MKLNRVVLAGYLVKDPELKTVGAKDTALANFTLAVQVKDDQPTLFMNCVAWGKRAETIGKYVKKGSNLYIDGELKQSNWEDKKTGTKRSSISMVVNNFQFIADRQESKAADMPASISEDEIPF
jgi:single-strand DNA-binding protein